MNKLLRQLLKIFKEKSNLQKAHWPRLETSSTTRTKGAWEVVEYSLLLSTKNLSGSSLHGSWTKGRGQWRMIRSHFCIESAKTKFALQTFVHAFYYLATSPEYIQTLWEEEVVKSEGWTEAGLTKCIKLIISSKSPSDCIPLRFVSDPAPILRISCFRSCIVTRCGEQFQILRWWYNSRWESSFTGYVGYAYMCSEYEHLCSSPKRANI